MNSFTGKKLNNGEYVVEGIGAFKFHKWPNDNFWMRQFDITESRPPIDLSITVEDDAFPTKMQIENLTKLLFSFSQLENVIFKAVQESFSRTESSINADVLKTMYFISSINLKNDKGEFWIVLEPFPEVGIKYDQFLRFTIKDMIITWSNIY